MFDAMAGKQASRQSAPAEQVHILSHITQLSQVGLRGKVDFRIVSFFI